MSDAEKPKGHSAHTAPAALPEVVCRPHHTSDSVNHHRTFEVLTVEPVQSRASRVIGRMKRKHSLSPTHSRRGAICISAARMRLDHSQLMALLAGLDWKKIRAAKVRRPLVAAETACDMMYHAAVAVGKAPVFVLYCLPWVCLFPIFPTTAMR
ncbi:hypothetical protein ACDY96_15000 [Rhizobium mongolense]|uniref:hypothetical protein n=1 Tax=Rhizobium mongolense TaxID=57676 RepID=UPI0035584818